ncbi:MAG: CRISPR-associated helicase Cas3' [Sulfuricurvum sp.]|jgi:CRISPR-associated endonuclease/helicase Cas3|uniref:CRISPR-associated helicase Cas3' n=1 Tax=Sulfuricurvum sp. TaxID=2025608 RepID=UPI0025D726D3|nr:CRISPR-associated helicase Cas3' [Sulfuricurvum sp.]MCK9372752.1 CRISPR-associated helicase Cas3' [Sulfuricurvum sp.]
MLLSNFGVDERFHAHTSKTDEIPSETLINHLDLTMEYFHKISTLKNLDSIINSLIHTIDTQNFILIKEMFENAIYLHDLGKKNPCFQAKKMKNPLFKGFEECGDSNHSHGGALEYLDYYKQKIDAIQDDHTYYRLIFILYNFAYHIDKHHGALGNIETYFSKTNQEQKNHPDFNNIKKNIDSYIENKFEFYILNKLLFSLLVSSDYYATTEYMAAIKTEDFGLFSADDKERLKAKFDEYLSSPKFQNPQGINKLRNDMFEEAQKNLLQNLAKNIFYLEAPTGSGKTITSINLALQLLTHDEKLNKLFYIFPFNTLVEQTKNVFDEIFKDELKIEVINSITPITINEEKQEDEESKYQKSYINRLFFHSPAIITTHVSLFNILFGTSKEDNFPLWQLANSIIILDEIQSYNNHLWWYMVEFFDKYASHLNIKIIIMSATLPKLDFFLEKKDNFVALIGDEKRKILFGDDLFKKSVTMDFSLIDGEMNIEKLVEILRTQPKEKKILFEFIKKQSAREFYNTIKDEFDNVYELSGDDNKAYRQYVINKSKNETLIIVATQVIEAGVDIDMDIGFKDISTIDSEEQFMGRINRSCLREGIVYFFDMDDVGKIYRDDNRLGFDLKQDKYKEILSNKDFGAYYKEVLEVIQTKGLRYNNGLLSNYDNFAELLKKLNYKEISKTMILINSQNFTLYFPFQIDLSIYEGVKEFALLDEVFLTDGKLDGQKVWDEFKLINTIEGFSKREYQKSKLNALMQFFTFTIFKNYTGQRPYIGEEEHGYYYVKNYEEFITSEGKFDREQYNTIKSSNFL